MNLEPEKKEPKKTSKSLLASLPPRMEKPVLDLAAKKALNKVLSGNENVYLYDPVLQELAEIRKEAILRGQAGQS